MNSFFTVTALNWLAVALYIVATILVASSFVFQRPRSERLFLILVLAGLIPHGAAILIQWSLAGHGPYISRQEILISMAWISVLFFLAAAWRYPRLRPAGIIALPICFLMIAIGLFMNPEIKKLPPTFRSIWLVFHVLFNKIAAGSMILAFGTAILQLVKGKKGEEGIGARLPAPEVLDGYSYKLVGFGFIFWSITIGAGAIWANEAWGRYWGWDPIETWSLITWLLFGLYLHLRYFFNWHGKKAAWLVIACFVTSLVAVFLIPLVADSLHAEYFS